MTARITVAMFSMGRLPDEVLEHIFHHIDTRTVTMVVPRVCRRWEHVCAHAVFAELDLSWARTSLSQVADADARTAAVRSVVRRMRGARRGTRAVTYTSNQPPSRAPRAHTRACNTTH